MAKYLNSYGNTNYRSFGGDGISLQDLSDINIIIGQNNSGKSNVLRSIDVWNSYRRGSPVLQNIDFYQNEPSNKISFRFEAHDKSGFFADLLDGSSKGTFIEFEITPQQGLSVSDSFIRHADDAKVRRFSQAHTSGSSSVKAENVRRIENLSQFQGLFQLPEIVFVPESRMSFQPKDVRERLQPIWHHGAANAKMRPIRKALKEFIEESVQSKIEIHFEPNGDSFSIQTEDDNLIEFDSLGSGIKQIFNLALIIAHTTDSIVLIDEPEMNMHPSLLRRLMKLIFANTTNQYFIATHSNVMLDASFGRLIYQIFGGNTSSVKKCLSASDTRLLLDDLGAKASDLLQSNGIIWIEGPSDRTYINKWLELFGSSHNEGLDFTYQYYGGKLLAHYDVDSDLDDFVDILNINKNAFIVIDSDWKESKRDWKEKDLALRKQKIIRACKNAGIHYWVTEGTEIENYISDEVWSAFISKKVKLGKYENIQSKSTKYTVKAKAAHDVARLLVNENIKAGTDLEERIHQIDSDITSWNKP